MIKGSWAMIWPDGRMLADSDFKNAQDVWRVCLGWPDEEEIERAKKSGYKVRWVKVATP